MGRRSLVAGFFFDFFFGAVAPLCGVGTRHGAKINLVSA